MEKNTLRARKMLNTVTPFQQYLVCTIEKVRFEGKVLKRPVTPAIERSRFSGKNDTGER